MKIFKIFCIVYLLLVFPVHARQEKITVSGVEMNNFYSSEDKMNTRGDMLVKDVNDYQIIFFGKENSFLISILGSPFSEKKQQAEKDFLEVLGINRESACKLKVSITTPDFVNPEYSGGNYGLSFCREKIPSTPAAERENYGLSLRILGIVGFVLLALLVVMRRRRLSS